MPEPDLVAEIKHDTDLEPCKLIGCMRKNAWVDESWRDYRGNALLKLLSNVTIELDSPAGYFEVYARMPYLLQFRGGHRKVWWDHDIKKILALAKHLQGCILIQEVDGNLHQHYIESPSTSEAESIVLAMREKWEGLERIAKNTQRAHVMCHHCPVKKRCDALDLERNQTDDWPKDYHVG